MAKQSYLPEIIYTEKNPFGVDSRSYTSIQSAIEDSDSENQIITVGENSTLSSLSAGTYDGITLRIPKGITLNVNGSLTLDFSFEIEDSGQITINENVTINGNVLVKGSKSGIYPISVSSSYTLTLYEPECIIANEKQTIFTGNGDISFTNSGVVSAGWFNGSDIGDSINKAIKALGTLFGTVKVPKYTEDKQFSTRILFNSDKTLDFQSSPLEYTGSTQAMVTAKSDLSAPISVGDGENVLNTYINDLKIRSTGDIANAVLDLVAFRSSRIVNAYISQNASVTDTSSSLIRIQSGQAGQGCHYNYLEDIQLRCNENVSNGLLQHEHSTGTRLCNDNFYKEIECTFPADEGIVLRDGVGNRLINPSVESPSGTGDTTGTGILLDPNLDSTTIVGFYGENMLYGIDMNNCTNLMVIAGRFAGSVSNMFNNRDLTQLTRVGADPNRSDDNPSEANNASAPYRISNNLTIGGALSKGSGSFRITHPVLENKFLYHSFIEGPQCDLIYRGIVKLKNGIAKINLDNHSNMTQGTFEKLNKNIQPMVNNTSGWTPVKCYVKWNLLTIEAKDSDCNDIVSWVVIGERNDDYIRESKETDENGNFITERDK